MPIPDKIANAPLLYLGLDLYYSAFMDLTTCRGHSYGTEGAISYLHISEYCMVHDIWGEQRDDMIYHMQHMDAAYLQYKGNKLKSSRPPKK